MFSLLCLCILFSLSYGFGKKRFYHKSKARRSWRNGTISRGLDIKTGNILRSTPVEAINVLDYGAVGDGSYDNTAAFKKALEAALNQGSSFVFAPTGKYKFLGQINIPDGVSLVGSYLTCPQHEQPKEAPDDGTVFLPYYGRHSSSISDSFITVGYSAALQGVSIYYPDQPCTSALPAVYPPTIYMNKPNSAVFDVELLNSYYGMYVVEAHRHFISRVEGQPILVGLYVDETYDIGRLEDVHWNPWFCKNTGYLYTQMTYGRAFVMGRSDWEYVLNTFSFGYAIGYHFIQTSTGSMNGNFLGIGADYCTNYSVLVDASQPMGLLITNGEFTAFHNSQFAPNSTSVPMAVKVGSGNKGNVNFENTAFWGPMQYCAQLFGDSTTVFSNCVFVQWDRYHKNGSPCIYSNKGNVILNGNTFQQSGSKQAHFDTGTEKAIVSNNIINGNIDIQVGTSVKTGFSNNL